MKGRPCRLSGSGFSRTALWARGLPVPPKKDVFIGHKTTTKQAPDDNFVLFDEISVLRKTNHIAEMGFGTFKTDATCTNILKQTCQKSLDKMQGI